MSVHHDQTSRRRSQPSTPSELFISLRQRYPSDSRDELIERYADVCEAGGLFVREHATDWARLNCNRLTSPPTPPASPAERKQQQEQRARLDTEAANKLNRASAKLVLSGEMVIEGKRLADHTFGEVAKMGGWLVEVSKMGKPKQRIGDVLTEEDLKKIKVG